MKKNLIVIISLLVIISSCKPNPTKVYESHKDLIIKTVAFWDTYDNVTKDANTNGSQIVLCNKLSDNPSMMTNCINKTGNIDNNRFMKSLDSLIKAKIISPDDTSNLIYIAKHFPSEIVLSTPKITKITDEEFLYQYEDMTSGLSFSSKLTYIKDKKDWYYSSVCLSKDSVVKAGQKILDKEAAIAAAQAEKRRQIEAAEREKNDRIARSLGFEDFAQFKRFSNALNSAYSK
jgi:hypothetical protein